MHSMRCIFTLFLATTNNIQTMKYILVALKVPILYERVDIQTLKDILVALKVPILYERVEQYYVRNIDTTKC